jgi:hypothetical protein
MQLLFIIFHPQKYLVLKIQSKTLNKNILIYLATSIIRIFCESTSLALILCSPCNLAYLKSSPGLGYNLSATNFRDRLLQFLVNFKYKEEDNTFCPRYGLLVLNLGKNAALLRNKIKKWDKTNCNSSRMCSNLWWTVLLIALVFFLFVTFRKFQTYREFSSQFKPSKGYNFEFDPL